MSPSFFPPLSSSSLCLSRLVTQQQPRTVPGLRMRDAFCLSSLLLSQASSLRSLLNAGAIAHARGRDFSIGGDFMTFPPNPFQLLQNASTMIIFF